MGFFFYSFISFSNSLLLSFLLSFCYLLKGHCSEFWQWEGVGLSRHEPHPPQACGDHNGYECVLWVSQPVFKLMANTLILYKTHTHTHSTTQEQNPRGALGYPALCTQSVLVAQGKTFKLKAKSHLLQNNIQLGQTCEHPTLKAACAGQREEVDVTKAVSSCFLQFWLWLIKQPAIKFLWVWMCLVIWNYLHAWLLPQR